MKMTPEEFEAWPNRAITLMGMSGIGKTTLANRLPKSRWFHFSGDYRIGTKYLQEPILDNIKRQAMQVEFLRDLLRSDSIYICSNITVHNLEPVSSFLGKVGRADLGGLSIEEFKRRQVLHREAEIGAMRDVGSFIAKAREIYGYEHFVNDAGGSICELDDETTLQALADATLIIYIRADRAMEEELIRRGLADPKPLYYTDEFFDPRLAEYLRLNRLRDVNGIHPDEFVQWIFSKLVDHRRPLYQAIADEYGYSVDANAVERVRGEADLLALIASALRDG